MSSQRERCLIYEILLKRFSFFSQKLKVAMLVLPPPPPQPPPKAHIWHINVYKLKVIYKTKQ